MPDKALVKMVGKVVIDGADINVGEIDGDEGPAGEIIEAPVEEVDPHRHLPTPELPSASEVARHREDHLPYQSWCDQCVEGRGR